MGRPRKIKDNEVENMATSVNENETAEKKPARRGRPPKAKKEEQEVDSVSAEDAAAESSSSDGVQPIRVDLCKEKIRSLISGIYDIQKLRIATGNRIVQSFNIQMGQKPGTKQEDMEKQVQSMINLLRMEYTRITDAYTSKSYVCKKKTDGDSKEVEVKLGANDGIEKIIKKMSENKDADITYVRSKMDYDLIGNYVDLCDIEKSMVDILDKYVVQHPMWDKFFKDVKGCGTLMAAVCIAYFDIHKARHVSSFWKYAGLDTVEVMVPRAIGMEDGKVIYSDTEYETVREGRSKRHTEDYEYVSKDGEVKTKRGITYNPELKTKLMGVLGPCMIKAGIRTVKDEKGNPVLDANGNPEKQYNTKYTQLYSDYRNRLDNRADSATLTTLHKHNMAMRYMVKQFVRDLWVTWRAYEGYEVSEPYEVAKLGYKPHKYNEYHERIAKQTHDEHVARSQN